VPVGVEQVRCRLRLRPAEDTDPGKLQMLLAATEYSCVVLQTLRKGVPVETCVSMVLSARPPEACARHGSANKDAVGVAVTQTRASPILGR
jgi:hypothetical protein